MVGVSLSQFLFNLSLFVTNTELSEAAPKQNRNWNPLEKTQSILRLYGSSQIM